MKKGKKENETGIEIVETITDKVPTENEGLATIKVRFKNTYVGKLGNFYEGKTYELSDDLYDTFKNDCEAVN